MQSEDALERALSAGQMRPDRLPGLLAVFSQLPGILTDELQQMSQLHPKIKLLDVRASTFGETVLVPAGGLAGIVRAERWRSWIYFIADLHASILAIESATGIEAFSAQSFRQRAYTKTDLNIARVLFRKVAKSLTGAFSLLIDVAFDVMNIVERIEADTQPSPNTPVLIGRLAIDYGGHTGMISIVIPQAALEPVRDILAAYGADGHPPAGAQRFRDDTAWSKRLSEEIARSFITLSGVLEERTIELGAISRFAVGTVVPLETHSISRVRLDVDDKSLFWCELGKRDEDLILRVEADFDSDREAIDEFYGL